MSQKRRGTNRLAYASPAPQVTQIISGDVQHAIKIKGWTYQLYSAKLYQTDSSKIAATYKRIH